MRLRNFRARALPQPHAQLTHVLQMALVAICQSNAFSKVSAMTAPQSRCASTCATAAEGRHRQLANVGALGALRGLGGSWSAPFFWLGPATKL